MLSSTLQTEVQTSATVLDKYKPGWANRINPDILNLASPCTCVLGQLFTYYAYGMWFFEDKQEYSDGSLKGFRCTSHETDRAAALKVYWLQEIENRRNKIGEVNT
jgi:hypothetical protein